MAKGRYLFISDLQAPFHAPKALEFSKYVQKEYAVEPQNVCCVGDEVDEYFGSLYSKSIDGLYTATQEIQASYDELSRWYRAFPQMKLATSNHGQRWLKKASAAEIPSQMIRSYQEILKAPSGWKWQDKWTFPGKRPMQMIHGLGYSGMYAYRQVPLDHGISTVFGHLHANAGIAHIVTESQKLWGMCVGSLIDPGAYAFEYNKHHRFKPWLGVGVVVDHGLTPILIPFDSWW